jgi:predicted AlkP superfamily pyrophosphatase or phosphodiesterase
MSRRTMRVLSFAVMLVSFTALGGRRLSAQAGDGPTLIVMISVDQLRGDLITRYSPAFTGGFRRFLDAGFRFSGASHAHAVTHTAAGHATLSTGTFPSRSGIVANSWQQKMGSTWQPMYAVEDRGSPILGLETVEQLPGRSPKNLMRTGLADWVRAADPEARTASVSAKDRAAITMAGKTDSNVFWLVSPLARFVTSTYYADEYPAWVTDFNQKVMPGIVAGREWNSVVPDSLKGLARQDAEPYEGDGVHTSFPHRASDEMRGEGPQAFNAWALGQSRLDDAILAFARTLTDNLELGQRGRVDYLGISLSATDYVGHGYGPLSQEQLSNLVQLDGELGAFLDYLDKEVGEGKWVVGLSADHGVVTMPEYSRAMDEPLAQRLLTQDENAKLGAVLQEASAAGGSPRDIAERTKRLLEERRIVAKAYTHQEFTEGEPADSFAVLFRNSYYPGRAHHMLSQYGVETRYRYKDLVSYPTGTTHGSPYWYDRWVPLILLGAGVEAGQSDAGVYTVDLAPTLAALAGVPTPTDLDGQPIYPRN